ncbi:MAG: hypothetical protein ACK5MR_06925 [Cumulibacter sp.]
MPGQLPLFESDGAELSVDDLDGVLLGTGHVVRRDGQARVSVLVDEVWRAEALCAEFDARGLDTTYEINRDEGSALLVRTALTDRLNPIAERWQLGRRRTGRTIKLTGAALRLWVLCAGRRTEAGYLLGLAPSEEIRWAPAGAALAAVGLTATLVGPRGGGPAYRVTSAKRLARLAALTGPRPDMAPEYVWP